jgi:pimeloyl-ACP methyl ester carboxylesterase
MQRWLRGVSSEKKTDLIPEGWFDAFWASVSASDPEGMERQPPAPRAPNGVLHDLFKNWFVGKPTHEPERITVPVMLIVGEWDSDTHPALAEALFRRLTKAQKKRLVLVGEATHMLVLEKNRSDLFSEVQGFLEERP